MQNGNRGVLSLVLLAYTETFAAQGALRPPPELARHVARSASMSAPAINSTDVVFERETELSVIFNSIAQKGKFNVALDPRVHQKMTLTLKSVEPLDALETVAKLNGLRIRRISGKRGVTYAIANPDVIERCICVGYTRAVQIEGMRASEVASKLARSLGRDQTISVLVDERTNKLIMRGTEETLARAAEIIAPHTRRR